MKGRHASGKLRATAVRSLFTPTWRGRDSKLKILLPKRSGRGFITIFVSVFV
jgi:hypothetical protein